MSTGYKFELTVCVGSSVSGVSLYKFELIVSAGSSVSGARGGEGANH